MILFTRNCFHSLLKYFDSFLGKGGKNRRRGKNENETEKRELVFKEDGQGSLDIIIIFLLVQNGIVCSCVLCKFMYVFASLAVCIFIREL